MKGESLPFKAYDRLFLFVCVVSSANSEPQREVVLFDKADVNDDGQLTLAELNKVFFLFDANSK